MDYEILLVRDDGSMNRSELEDIIIKLLEQWQGKRDREMSL